MLVNEVEFEREIEALFKSDNGWWGTVAVVSNWNLEKEKITIEI